MLLALFFRFLRYLVTGIICSLPIYLVYLEAVTDNTILFLSLLAFIILIIIDTYQFSFDFWEINHYFLGLLLPLVIYIVLGFLTCMFFPPVVFNRIFLPLRFAWAFGMRTIESIPVVSGGIIAIVTVMRFFVARAGREFYE